jgi:hypothetical protein
MGTAASWVADDRPSPLLVAILVVVSVADITTTQVALGLGAAAELSPIGRHIVGHGPLAMAAAKLVAAVAVGFPRWYGRRICLAGLALMTAAAAGSNALQVAARTGLF